MKKKLIVIGLVLLVCVSCFVSGCQSSPEKLPSSSSKLPEASSEEPSSNPSLVESKLPPPPSYPPEISAEYADLPTFTVDTFQNLYLRNFDDANEAFTDQNVIISGVVFSEYRDDESPFSYGSISLQGSKPNVFFIINVTDRKTAQELKKYSSGDRIMLVAKKDKEIIDIAESFLTFTDAKLPYEYEEASTVSSESEELPDFSKLETITADEFHQEYIEDLKGANQKYANQFVVLSGFVKEEYRESSSLWKGCIMITGENNPKTYCQFYVNDEETIEKLKQYSVGDKVTLIGKPYVETSYNDVAGIAFKDTLLPED